MSLAQHVTQAEGFDYEGPAGVGHGQDPEPERGSISPTLAPSTADDKPPEWRQLSYAPVDLPQEDKPARKAAYRVSNVTRIAQVATGVIACWLASGIVFGFAALKPVLIAEGVYGDLCEDELTSVTGRDRTDPDMPCKAQDMRLNLFFIMGSITANLASLLAGSCLDRFGRRFCWVLACVCIAVGAILMAASFSIPDFQGYIAGNIALSLGGTFLFVPSFELANAFPRHSGLIVALITGAFDASAAVFLFYRLAYDSTNGHFSPSKFFYAYLVVPLLIFITEFAYMPTNRYHTLNELEGKIEKAQDPMRDVHDSDEEISDMEELTRVRSVRAENRQAKLDRIESIAGDAEQREERVKIKEERQEASVVWGVLHGLPFIKQMQTPWYILILIQTTIQMFRMNYFIATIRDQYAYILGSEDAARSINHFFDAALPIGGVATTPIIGILLNNFSVPAISGILTVFIIALGVLNCLPYFWAGYATVVAFVIFRPLYYSAISDYAAKVFGFATFGRIYGTVVCISGFTNFAQSGIDALVYGPLHGNPIPVNVALGVSGAIVGLILTVFVAVNGRVFAQEKAECEAECESENESQRLLARHSNNGYGTN